jgi:hypothetical protein
MWVVASSDKDVEFQMPDAGLSFETGNDSEWMGVLMLRPAQPAKVVRPDDDSTNKASVANASPMVLCGRVARWVPVRFKP